MRRLFSFPNPVNEISARIVAAGALTMCLAIIVADRLGYHQVWWLSIVLAYGFVARVLTGPKLSPLGLLATRVVTPALRRPAKLVPGPPKRFAQGMGVVFSGSALALGLVLHQYLAGVLVLGALSIAAGLESIFAICLGCEVFKGLMRIGMIPETVCEECNNIWLRRQRLAARANG